MATSTDDVEQCGYAFSTTGGGTHAVRWSGSAATVVDMHSSTPATWSYCLGNHGGQYVGYGERPVYFTTYQDAFMWTSAGGAPVALGRPVTYSYSKALGVRNGQQVGYASTVAYPAGDVIGYHPASHAMVWAGGAGYVDLNPANFSASEALATNGTQQGGWAYTALPIATQHAMLWSGTPESAVDLHPAAYSDSKITALTDTKQVGDGWVGPMGAPGSVRHALVWSGTADSVVDLNQYLPPGYTHAVATGIDANGNVVGYAYNTPASGFAIPADAISVVFAPAQPGSITLSSLTLSPLNPAPGQTVTGIVTLAGAAPAGGVTLTFTPANAALLTPPATLVIPAGSTSASFTVAAGGSTLQTPLATKLYVTDGTVSRAASITVTPIVNVSSVTVNPVEGGFSTAGYFDPDHPGAGRRCAGELDEF